MTDTNLNRAAKIAGYDDWSDVLPFKASFISKSIQAHAATLDELDAAKAELEAFKREVSDAVCELIDDLRFHFDIPADVTALTKLRPFIITKPDPLIDAVCSTFGADIAGPGDADKFRAALAARGLEIREIDQ